MKKDINVQMYRLLLVLRGAVSMQYSFVVW